MSETSDTFCKEPLKETQDEGCCGGGNINRRTFLRIVSAGGLTLGTPPPIMAGPFENTDFDANVPANKRLDPAWVKSLFERGTPEVFKGAQLKTIRMPAGGVGAGHVYLSGEGRLTDWRVDARPASTGGDSVPFPLEQGFALRTVSGGRTDTRTFDQHGFPGMTFRGEYPIAKLEYRDAASPVETSLEAFSPFIPLDAESSGFPATILNFTLENTSQEPVEATILGGLQNGICFFNRFSVPGNRSNQILRGPGLSMLLCTVESIPNVNASPDRSEILFEDWAKPTFEGWTVEGTAFGSGPIPRPQFPKKDIGGEGAGVVSSFFATHDMVLTGKLTSAPFIIQRRYINFWLGGADLEDKTWVRLTVDGQPVQSQLGWWENRLSMHVFDVRSLEGKQARIEIADLSGAQRRNLSVGRISFSDVAGDGTPLTKMPDYGSMALAMVGPAADVGYANGTIGFEGQPSDHVSVPLSQPLKGSLGRTIYLKPGESAVVTFIVSWYFPNLTFKKLGEVGRHYATKFDSAESVATHLANNLDSLAGTTRLWRDTWYDSTLPIWFLDRTLLNVSTLATSGCYRFADGRFYAWEGGPDCCPGTCTHVWQYAHSMSRIFPALERDTRERVDLNIAMHSDTGVIGFRAEFDMGLAVDGQAGTILRIYREHQMSSDGAFLKRSWDKIKKVYDPLFALDPDQDGILEGEQMNTLDRPCFGQISWLSSMYVAALRAGEHMAREIDDPVFEARCRIIAVKGTRNITSRLYNGEYFVSLVDPDHLNTLNFGTGSHIDQVYGQSWAFQVGLPRVLPEKETRSALQSLWKYNFTPDVGAYFTAHKAGRRFVSVGDAGMIICTFPRKDWDYIKAGSSYYFNETWTGNEYQVASHMFWEGMLLEPMAIVRAIHERYNPTRRNPFSEFECGSHYARAMASHGAMLGICGFEYHGPQGHIAFAPRLSPEKFRAPFTAAEGWGTYAQIIEHRSMNASLEIKFGELKLKTINLAWPGVSGGASFKATLDGKHIQATCTVHDGLISIQFTSSLTIATGKTLRLAIA
jgi:non-lysosomal glucosylceramidase